MNDLNEEQEFLLQQALKNFSANGIPAADTLAASGVSARDEQVVRERIERMSAGVLR